MNLSEGVCFSRCLASYDPELRYLPCCTLHQDVGPRVWADMTRVLLAMRNAELATPSAASNAVVQSHIKAMEQLDDVASSFTRLKDVNGIHCCAKLAWNTGWLW